MFSSPQRKLRVLREEARVRAETVLRYIGAMVERLAEALLRQQVLDMMDVLNDVVDPGIARAPNALRTRE